MQTRMVTVREGELLGPVDWDFDFAEHLSNFYPNHPEERERLIAQLYALSEVDGPWEATTDGGWPRVGWGEVLDIGMYDGWPYWKPVPSVWIASFLGGAWHSFSSISEIRRKPGSPTQPNHES